MMVIDTNEYDHSEGYSIIRWPTSVARSTSTTRTERSQRSTRGVVSSICIRKRLSVKLADVQSKHMNKSIHSNSLVSFFFISNELEVYGADTHLESAPIPKEWLQRWIKQLKLLNWAASRGRGGEAIKISCDLCVFVFLFCFFLCVCVCLFILAWGEREFAIIFHQFSAL